ncbi:MAG TPA: hypothetical protein EYO51_07230 [Methylococcaceae bacterium]|nr:hypothetical protein [Methylococcaceae bacterium]HIB62913.1 hypothetical protein [Methylococcaceae bacterium]HIN67840.1 hypothetical protein [Methylococcales bacterium]HIO12075.1 hypothetical protein [Methylococcales bacterium]
MITYKIKTVTLLLGLCLLPLEWVHATTAGQDKIHVTSESEIKKEGDSLFSLTLQWRLDNGRTYESTAMAFINGPDKLRPDTAISATKKLKSAMYDALEELYPNSRGVKAVTPKKQPEVTISNNAGFSFTRVTFRDYANQKLSYDLVGQSFGAAQVNFSVDMVYFADIAYLDEFAPPKQTQAAGGGITITIDNNPPIQIATKNKDTRSIEKELANAISQATFSNLSIIPHSRGGGKRNSKPFDGGEIQFSNLAANKITIDLKDPSLGVLTKFQFKDTANEQGATSYFKWVFAVLILLGAGYFFYSWYKEEK